MALQLHAHLDNLILRGCYPFGQRRTKTHGLSTGSEDKLNVVMPGDEAVQRSQQSDKVRKIKRHFYPFCFSDSVRFGDIVMQPPSLTAKPRKAAQTNKVSRTIDKKPGFFESSDSFP